MVVNCACLWANRNRLISGELEPVLSHIEKLYKLSNYGEFSNLVKDEASLKEELSHLSIN